MTQLPAAYQWLADEPGPKMLIEALKLYNTLEWRGGSSNPEILGWAQECGIKGYCADEIPWCGLFVAIVAHRAGKTLPEHPLWARDWLHWGTPAHQPELGDVLVFSRGSGGHVGLYVGHDATTYHVMGGNQSDRVCITRITKARLLGARRMYREKPANVRRVNLAGSGKISTNEA